MKHLRLFENFEDDLSPITRDMFNLIFVVELKNGYFLKGPVEHKEEAQKIANYIEQELDDTYNQYDDLGSESRALDEVEERFDELREELAEELAAVGYYIEDEE